MSNAHYNTGIVTQPGLGTPERNYRPGSNMAGQLKLGKVIKVHHYNNSVDIQLVKSGHIISSNPDVKGRYAPRQLSDTAHYDETTMSYSGSVKPLQEGQLVIVGFLDNSIKQPVILGSMYNNTDRNQNPLLDEYPVDPNRGPVDEVREGLKTLNIYPSQMYTKVDGIGGIEISHPSKSFLKIDADEPDISDEHDTFDHDNLSEKHKATNETIAAKKEITAFSPEFLFVHRTSFDNDDTTWTKTFIDKFGTLRFTRDPNDGTLSYLELEENGSIRAKRQIDDNIRGNAQNTSEVLIENTGKIELTRDLNGQESTVEIAETGEIRLKHKSGSLIEMDDNGDIIIKPARYLWLG